MKDLVIARYNESLEWLLESRETYRKYNIHVYNKGGEVDNPEWLKDLCAQQHQLENVGREAHTYLTHIIRNYDNLADITVFTQGNPLDHCKFTYRMNALRNSSNISYLDIGAHTYFSDNRGGPWDSCPLHSFWPKITSDPLRSDLLNFTRGAIFAVHKDVIRKHSKVSYENLLSLHKEEKRFAWLMERLWRKVFCGITSLK